MCLETPPELHNLKTILPKQRFRKEEDRKAQKQVDKQKAIKNGDLSLGNKIDPYQVVNKQGDVVEKHFKEAVFDGATLHPDVIERLFDHYDRDSTIIFF